MPQLPWLIVSSALLVLPMVLGYFAAPRGQSSLASAMLRIPVAFAVDVFLVTLLAAFIPFAHAALVARVVYVVVFVAHRLAGSGRVAHDPKAFALALVVFALAVVTTYKLTWSSTYLGDRQWHIPLVASLEGQKLPFANVFNGARLHYHVGGDLLAAEARALSFDHLSSTAALALVHDLFTGLAAAWLVLFARALGVRSWLFPAFCALALAHHGLIPAFIGAMTRDEPFYGFNMVSYRPHVPVSFLASVMLIGGVVARLVAPQVRWARRAIIGGFLVISICDEASVGVLGLAIGATWLFFPRILASTRLRGIGVLVLLALAVVLPNVFVSGTVGHGGAVRSLRWVLPRFAGTEGIHTPLFSSAGVILILQYLASPVAAVLVLAASRFRRPSERSPGPSRGVVGFAVATLFVAGTFALCILVNNSAGEAQRYYVPMFLAPIVAMALVADTLRRRLRPIIVFALGVPAIASFYEDASFRAKWRLSEFTAGSHSVDMPFDLFEVDCADVTPSHLGEPPQRMYVDHTGYRLYSTCRSLWLPGSDNAGWKMAIYPDYSVERQRTTLAQGVPDDTVRAACWRKRSSDAVCADLKARGLCKPSDLYFVECDFPLPPNRVQRRPNTSSSASAM